MKTETKVPKTKVSPNYPLLVRLARVGGNSNILLVASEEDSTILDGDDIGEHWGPTELKESMYTILPPGTTITLTQE